MPIFYSALLLTGVNLLLRLVSTSFQVYISGRIGAAGVGLLQLVLSVGMMAMTAGTAGIRTATMYLTAEQLGKRKPQNIHWILRGCFLYSILCSSTVALLLYHAAPYLAVNWLGDIRSLSALRLFSVFLPVVCLSGCMTGYFTAANRIGTLAAVEIAEQLCSMTVTMCVLSLWAGNDIEKACASIVFGSSLGAVLTLTCLLVLRIREHSPVGQRHPVSRQLLHTAVPLALADDLKSGISTTENLMVPKRLALFPGTQEPLAVFGTVCGMVFPVLMFPAAILFGLAELLIPELARCAAAGSKTRIAYLVQRSLKAAMLYGILFGGLLFLLADKLCLWLYDSPDAGDHLRRYAILAPMLYCDAITDAMTKGLGQQTACVRYNILTSSMDVALLFLLLPKWGMDGYFFSFLVTHLLNFILSLRRLLRISNVHIPFYIPALSLSAAVASTWGASFLPSVVGRIAAYIGLLGSLSTLLGITSREDIIWLRGMLHKK